MAILATKFATTWKRSDHWYDHQTEFPEIADEIEYERSAAEFLNAVLGPTMVEGVRSSDGDTVRYDFATQNFAITRGRHNTHVFQTVQELARFEQ